VWLVNPEFFPIFATKNLEIMRNPLALAVAAIILLGGCQEEKAENENVTPTLATDTTAIAAIRGDGNYPIAVISNTTWAVIKDAATWFSILPTFGTGDGTIIVSILENNTLSTRAGTFTIVSGTLVTPVTVSVTQVGIVPALSADPPAIPATSTAHSYTIAVTSTIGWTATENSDWFAVAPVSGNGNGTITVSVEANPTTDVRAGAITLAAGTLTEPVSVTVTQAAAAPVLTVNSAVVTAAHSAGSYYLNVTSNTTWTATVAGNSNWCTVWPASASGNGTVTVGVEANTSETNKRSATITIAAGTTHRTVALTQSTPGAPLLAATARKWTFGTQTWSDAIQVPACAGSTFEYSTDPRCRTYANNGSTWYYYNWPYVDAHKETMCPTPWRVPTKDDLDALYESAGGSTGYETLFQHWGYGGSIITYRPIHPTDNYDKTLAYWSTTENGDKAYCIHAEPNWNGVYDNYYHVLDISKFEAGFQVRCVK
jgi:hypothetical protein